MPVRLIGPYRDPGGGDDYWLADPLVNQYDGSARHEHPSDDVLLLVGRDMDRWQSLRWRRSATPAPVVRRDWLIENACFAEDSVVVKFDGVCYFFSLLTSDQVAA